MKGAMSGATDQLWHGISKHLFKGTTYENNSGGEPKDILNLNSTQSPIDVEKYFSTLDKERTKNATYSRL